MWIWVELLGLGGRLSIERFEDIEKARAYIAREILPVIAPDDTLKVFEADENGE